jgi:hypothetical protein
MGGALSTPLAAQQRSAAWMFGLAATVGSGWQLEGADIGIVRPVGLGPLRFATLTGRFGTFQDEGGFLFGNRGFVAGLALGGQTSGVRIIDVGTEQNPISIAFDLTVEATGYLASNSPFPQGGAWLGLAVLPGFRTIQSESFGVSFMVGPALFIGRETDVRAFLAFRVEIPVARAPAAP